MDGIDPGAYLASLMGVKGASAAQTPAPSASAPQGAQNPLLAALQNGAVSASPAPTAAPAAGVGSAPSLDQQILKLAAVAGPTSQGQSTSAAPAVAPDESAANAKAAQTAMDAVNSKPAYLKLGIPPLTGVLQTPIRLPHALANTMTGMGAEGWRLGQGLWDSATGNKPDPLSAAVRQNILASPGGKVGSFLTDTLASAPLGGLAGLGLKGLGGIGARVAGSALGRTAVQGAVQGGVMANPGQRLQGAALGAAASPLLSLAGRPLAWAVKGLTRTPAAQALLDRGVPLTPGQLNPHGKVVNRMEQAFTALPWLGGAIANARAQGPVKYARTMVEDALAPGEKLTTTSPDFNDWVQEAKGGFDRAYRAALGSGARGRGFPMKAAVVNTAGPDVPLSQAFGALAAKPRLGLTQAQRMAMGKELAAKLNETIGVARRAGGLQADDLQQLRSDLRDAARDVSPVDNASRAQKAFWGDAQQLVTQALESQLPKKTADALRQIDQQYGKFAIVRNVARAAKDQPQGPSLVQWQDAIAQGTPPSAYAVGGGWNRGLSKAARDVFGTTVPHTGLTGAGTLYPAVEGIGAGLLAPHHPAVALGTLGGLAALRAAYSKAGLRALAGQTPVQRALQARLARIPPNALEAAGRYGRTALLARPLSVALGLPSAAASAQQ